MVHLSGCSQVVWHSLWERGVARSSRVTPTSGISHVLKVIRYAFKSRATKAFVNDSNKKNQLVLSCVGCTRQWTEVVLKCYGSFHISDGDNQHHSSIGNSVLGKQGLSATAVVNRHRIFES